MRALPVEFITLLESVPSVSIRNNPWTDLPPKWGRSYPVTAAEHSAPAEQYSSLSGYSASDVLALLYCARKVYPLAEQLFHELGAMYYSQRLGLQHFISELQVRLARSWEQGCEEIAKHIFFKSRSNGCFLTWCETDHFQRQEQQEKRDMDGLHREKMLSRSKGQLEEQRNRAQGLYGVGAEDLFRLGLRSTELGVHHEVERMAVLKQLRDKADVVKTKSLKREQQFKRKAELEANRLREIVKADEIGRLESKMRDADKERAKLFEQVQTTAMKINSDD